MTETPICYALLPAEFIKQDAGGQWIIVGLFSRAVFSEFPAALRIGAFYGLVDGRGEQALKFQVVSADDEFYDDEEKIVAGQVEGTLKLDSPLDQFESAATVPCVFPRPGRYNLELIINGELRMSRSIIIQKVDQGTQTGTSE